MFKPLTAFTLMASFLLLTACSVYPTSTSGSLQTRSDNVYLKIGFSDYDRNRIFRYYGYPHKRHGRIPPGYYKRYHRHKPLPHSFHPHPLPWELERHLTPLPSGYIRVMIGNDIAIMNTRTRIIYDVLWSIR